MKKTTQIIVRMTPEEKLELDTISKSNGGNVSKLVRYLILTHIQELKKAGAK